MDAPYISMVATSGMMTISVRKAGPNGVKCVDVLNGADVPNYLTGQLELAEACALRRGFRISGKWLPGAGCSHEHGMYVSMQAKLTSKRG